MLLLLVVVDVVAGGGRIDSEVDIVGRWWWVDFATLLATLKMSVIYGYSLCRWMTRGPLHILLQVSIDNVIYFEGLEKESMLWPLFCFLMTAPERQLRPPHNLCYWPYFFRLFFLQYFVKWRDHRYIITPSLSIYTRYAKLSDCYAMQFFEKAYRQRCWFDFGELMPLPDVCLLRRSGDMGGQSVPPLKSNFC
jgi:hypothetical protein